MSALTDRIAQIEEYIETGRMRSRGQLETQTNSELFLYWIGLLLKRQIEIDAAKHQLAERRWAAEQKTITSLSDEQIATPAPARRRPGRPRTRPVETTE